MTFHNTVASLVILLLATILPILWLVDPNPCALGSGFFFAQNTICIRLGILLAERYLNAIGVPGTCRSITAAMVTGFVYFGYWHMRVKSCSPQ